MKLTKDLANLPAQAGAGPGSVVSIGVFDGVHLGHQAILEANVAEAKATGAISSVVTFQGHPKQLLLGRAPRTLTSLEHRLELFAQAGIEHTLALPFDAELRAMHWRTFIEQVCVQELGARRFVLGFDSKFGRNREGTPASLADAGFRVNVAKKVLVAGRAISSTAIREAIELGDLEAASRMLGRHVSISAEVMQGDRIGRTLGFPTANLEVLQELHPPPGVYFGRARSLGIAQIDGQTEGAAESEQLHPAVVNIGFRPTLAAERPEHPRIEVHLLDWEGDLYGERLEVRFLGRLRGEERFAGLAELSAQIEKDCRMARELLSISPTAG